MKKMLLTSAACLLLLAPAGSGWAGPAGEGAGPALVLLPSTAWLYAAPDEKAHRFRIKNKLPSMKRTYKKGIFPLYATARPRRVVVFELVEPLPAGPGWAHLRPLDGGSQPATRCGFLSLGPGLVVDLYVRTEDLLATLSQPFQAGFEEGSEVRLLPGVSIRSTKKEGRYLAETPTLQIALPLPPGSLSRTFSPGEELAFGPSAALTKGPTKLQVSDEIDGTLFGVDIPLVAAPVKAVPGRWLMTAAESCARVKGFGRYRAADLAQKKGTVIPPSKPVWRLKAGSPIYWPDGREAGRTSAPLGFDRRDQVKTELGDRRCAKLDVYAGSKITLCFRGDRVARF